MILSLELREGPVSRPIPLHATPAGLVHSKDLSLPASLARGVTHLILGRRRAKSNVPAVTRAPQPRVHTVRERAMAYLSVGMFLTNITLVKLPLQMC